ncbi:MAG: TonB-dependent receptor, partial [Desulfobacterales bacterium]|nr:TonB-dependent receptor [Desulfobacterales bacterium]
AVFVITSEDIRRSGAATIPDLLRMAPGIQVARIDASNWAVSSRGFNGRFANKLLVLMDGRTVYTPLFSGVFWDVQDALLEEIDRIEVIRGPGAALWGANAVNGVINIITKEAEKSQGLLALGGVGTEERAFGAIRWGGHIGENGCYRLYTKYFNRDSTVFDDGQDAGDDWRNLRAGFRMDWSVADADAFTLQGDVYDGRVHDIISYPGGPPSWVNTVSGDTEISGGNILGRWRREFSETSRMTLQLYYDRTRRTRLLIPMDIHQTVDMDFQHQFLVGQHDVMWGVGYRFIRGDIDNSAVFILDDERRKTDLFSAFLQDDIHLAGDALRLILGIKLEHNDYTGFEIQPNARLLWTPGERAVLWASISRAMRTPSRSDHDLWLNPVTLPPDTFFPGAPPLNLFILGSRDYDSEELIAYELGCRVSPLDHLSVDIAAFFNAYDNLETTVPREYDFSTWPARLIMIVDNKKSGETYGFEVSADYEALDGWRLQAAYSYLQMNLTPDPGSREISMESAEESIPHNQLSLRSTMDLPWRLEFDLWLRYTDELPGPEVDDYCTLDARLGWRPKENLELALVGRNLLESRHQETKRAYVDNLPTDVERSVYIKATWRY